ncbi:MAG: glycosyltransferase family 2 protein [Alphaproteobacteria bacterium]|nr:glycosyltransferase family 2 protein [Alphaproteobacteria bacterium]
MAAVSIIIPTEDSVNNIDALLLSIFVQSVQDTEIIFVDNVSKDGTRKLLDRYVKFDKRVQVVKLRKKVSLTECCRVGLEHATAPYVYFMNGTKFVYINQGCLARLIDNAGKYDSDFVYSSCGMVDALTMDGIPLYQIPKENFVQKEVFSVADIPSDMLFKMYLSPWAKLYKREFLQKITFPKFEETFFLECIFNAEKISYDLDILYICHFTQKDLEFNNVAAIESANLEVLLKYNAFEKYKNAYIYHKMRCFWLGIMWAPIAQKQAMFAELKAEFADEDFGQYDFNVLRKEDLYWAVQNVKNLDWNDFKQTYIGSAA